MRIFLTINLSIAFFYCYSQVYIPVNVSNRKSLKEIRLTQIGDFGLVRKPRPQIPSHLHTGIDIVRPNGNYYNEPILPIAKGKIISIRDDGPFAQIIIEHKVEKNIFWSLYEHVAGILVKVGDSVNHKTQIARFMNKLELNKYGWQFDHLHLEILKVKPKPIEPSLKNPQRFYISYNLSCYKKEDLKMYYFNPLEFFENALSN